MLDMASMPNLLEQGGPGPQKMLARARYEGQVEVPQAAFRLHLGGLDSSCILSRDAEMIRSASSTGFSSIP